MPAHFDETWDEETGRELPRFLSTQPAEAPASRRWLVAGNRMARYGAMAAAACVALFASAYLAPENAPKRADVSASVEVMPVRIVRQDILTDTALHERLSFARHLQTQGLSANPSSAPSATEAPSRLQQVAEAADTPVGRVTEGAAVTLLLVRNLPEGTTFSDGIAAGLGVWAIGGQDPKVLLDVIEKAPSQPVTADVDLISASGEMLGSQKIDIPAVGIASTAPIVAVSPLAAHDAAPMTESSPAKNENRQNRPRVRASTDVAAADAADGESSKQKPPRKKRQVDDAYRNTRPAPAQAKTAQNENEKRADEPQGPIAKFFAWLAGGTKAASQNGAGTETAASSQYPRGTRHGLGMAPGEN